MTIVKFKVKCVSSYLFTEMFSFPGPEGGEKCEEGAQAQKKKKKRKEKKVMGKRWEGIKIKRIVINIYDDDYDDNDDDNGDDEDEDDDVNDYVYDDDDDDDNDDDDDDDDDDTQTEDYLIIKR